MFYTLTFNKQKCLVYLISLFEPLIINIILLYYYIIHIINNTLHKILDNIEYYYESFMFYTLKKPKFLVYIISLFEPLIINIKFLFQVMCIP